MAITYVQPQIPTTEHGLTRALMRHIDWTKKRCYPNVHLFPWESDLLVVSSSGYATEIEVKTTTQDWRADISKKKWRPNVGWLGQERGKDLNNLHGWQYIKTFFYAVPPQLIAQMPQLPDWVGVLTVDNKGKVLTHKPATMRKVLPLTPQQRVSLEASAYFRFVRQYMEKK